MPATRKPLLLMLALTGCGNLDELFCEPEGCDWKPGEWARVAALANPGPPPLDPSNGYDDVDAAVRLGRAFFFDPAFSGNATQLDAINRTSPPARAPICQPINVSCASCHDLARAGVDAQSSPGHVSVGAGWTDVNALGVVNSAYRPVVFWNGRADSLWALNAVVAESPTTMNGNRLRTAHQILQRYGAAYESVFGRVDRAMIVGLPANGKPKTPEYDALTEGQKSAVTRMLVNWSKAIAAYEHTLVSRNSPFDRFVTAGPGSDEISEAAKRGARLFVGKAGCVDCHAGPQLTDDDFHNIGVPQAGVAVPRKADCPASPNPRAADCDCESPEALKCAPWGAFDGLRRLRDEVEGSPTQNRWLRTGAWSSDPTDNSRQAYLNRPLTADLKGAWRTPSLRNVALTAPYMHDGRYATLEEAIWHYNTGARNAGAEQVNPDGIAAQIKPLMLTETEVSELIAFLQTLTGDEEFHDNMKDALADVGAAPTGLGGAGGSCAPTGAGGVGGTATGVGGAPGSGGMPMSTGAGGMGGSAALPPRGCVGVPPQAPLIADFSDATGDVPLRFGTAPGLTGSTFSRASLGLMPPVLSIEPGLVGSPALHVRVYPGAVSNPSGLWFRFGLSFDSCVDITAYDAVQFRILAGDLLSCPIRFGVLSSQTVSPGDDSRGTCATGPACTPPSTGIGTLGVVTIPFSGGTFTGSPNVVDPVSVLGIQWQVDASHGCNTSFLIDDVAFVNTRGAGGMGGGLGGMGGGTAGRPGP